MLDKLNERKDSSLINESINLCSKIFIWRIFFCELYKRLSNFLVVWNETRLSIARTSSWNVSRDRKRSGKRKKASDYITQKNIYLNARKTWITKKKNKTSVLQDARHIIQTDRTSGRYNANRRNAGVTRREKRILQIDRTSALQCEQKANVITKRK